MSPKLPNGLDGGVSKNARRGTKSRTGCQTCKHKRLKCDETKPSCSNCTKRGLVCPGYKQQLRWSTKYEASQSELQSQDAVHPSLEHQFSAIDPSIFGSVDTGKSVEHSVAVEQSDQGCSSDFAPQPMIASAMRHRSMTPAPLSFDDSNSPGAERWTTSLPDLIISGESSLVSYERPVVGSDRDSDADYEVQRISKSSNSSGSIPDPAQWKSLLRSYYRISAPAMPRSLHNETSALVEHYFRDVCVIFSAFDSAMNPFRTVIARLWDNSSSIFFAIQSMAAAHLANYLPHMRVTGLNMQRKAYECLQQELQLASINQTMDDKLLLAVLLLGLTACWHDSSDLGVAHLSAARALIQPRLLREDTLQGTDSTRNDQFFAEALIYWEMCMAFVSQETFVPGMERRLHATAIEGQESPPDRKVFPHPWTGIAPRVQMLFAEVGRLVRHYCTMKNNMFDMNAPQMDLDAIIIAAQDLEDELLSINLPVADDLVDVQDERTSKSDFISVAEATKCAALLEIYRVFPGVLITRMSMAQDGGSHSTFFNFETTSAFGSDLTDTSWITSWLTSLAIHTLDILSRVPISSGTRPLQLIMLVTASCELRLKTPLVSSPGLSASTSYDLKVAQSRGFVTARLNELATRLPSKPILQIMQLVREVWRRYDAGDDVFWMDVMTANGWETIMG